MNLEYFNKYRKYYDALKEQSIDTSAKILMVECSNNFKTISNVYLNKINESKWQEIARPIVVNNVFVSLKSQINNLNNYIADNLFVACDLAINSLYLKIEEIMKENINLETLNTNLESTKNICYCS